MKKLVCLVLATFLLLFAPAKATAQARKIPFQSFQLAHNGITYSVDPRIELLHTALILAGIPQINPVGTDYKLNIIQRFAPYKRHALFAFLHKYGPQGKLFTSVDAPIWYMLHLTPDLAWRQDISNPYHQQPLLDSLRILLQRFAVESHYATFFNSQAAFYRLSLATLRFNTADQNEKVRLLTYYGVADRAASYHFHLILNFLGDGNFGPRLVTPTGTEFYAVMAPTGSTGRVPTFSTSILYGLLWHEFGHGFANPLVADHLAEFTMLVALWEPLKSSMQAQAYNEWKSVLWEHLTNAVMCRLAAQKYGEDYATLTYVRPLLGKRWLYITPLLAALKEYEQNRVRYPTLRSFMPRIVETFKHIQPQDIAQWQQLTEQLRQPNVATLPVLGAIYEQQKVLFILATHETNQPGHLRLKAYVQAHQLAAFPSATLVDDTTALRMDVSSYHLFVIGTPTGNLFLQRVLPQLPAQVLPHAAIVGGNYSGHGYALMSGWVNPANYQKVMAIYTAQDPDDLLNFTWVPRGSKQYTLAKNLIPIKEGNYERSGLVWICP